MSRRSSPASLQRLFREYFEGRAIDRTAVHEAQRQPFKVFRLRHAVGVRPSVMTHTLSIDETFIERVAAQLRDSPRASLRMGTDAWMPSRNQTVEESTGEYWIDFEQMKALNDVCTKWCTKTYFPSASTRVNMVLNTIRTYDAVRRLVPWFRSKVLFKGGVMVRLMLIEYFNDLPLPARNAAIQHLHKYRALSMSDFDFEVVADKHDESDSVIHRRCLLEYAVLLQIQKTLDKEVKRGASQGSAGLLHTDWDEVREASTLRQMLQDEADANLPDGHPFYKATIDRVILGDRCASPPTDGHRTKTGAACPSPRENIVIFDCHDGKKCIAPAASVFQDLGVKGVPTRSSTRLYCTLNSYIGERKQGDPATRAAYLRGVFHLSRIKHAFIVFYTTRDGHKRCDQLSGEMIDLSQSHGDETDEVRALMHKMVTSPYLEYPVVGVPSNVKLRSYSTSGFLFEHMTMLHRTENECWEVTKLEKRLARHVAFLCLYVLSPEVAGAYDDKLAQMRRLAARLATRQALFAPSRTPFIHEIATFLRIEQASLKGAPVDKATTYLTTLSMHLTVLLDALAERSVPPLRMINSKHLETASGLLYANAPPRTSSRGSKRRRSSPSNTFPFDPTKYNDAFMRILSMQIPREVYTDTLAALPSPIVDSAHVYVKYVNNCVLLTAIGNALRRAPRNDLVTALISIGVFRDHKSYQLHHASHVHDTQFLVRASKRGAGDMPSVFKRMRRVAPAVARLCPRDMNAFRDAIDAAVHVPRGCKYEGCVIGTSDMRETMDVYDRDGPHPRYMRSAHALLATVHYGESRTEVDKDSFFLVLPIALTFRDKGVRRTVVVQLRLLSMSLYGPDNVMASIIEAHSTRAALSSHPKTRIPVLTMRGLLAYYAELGESEGDVGTGVCAMLYYFDEGITAERLRRMHAFLTSARVPEDDARLRDIDATLRWNASDDRGKLVEHGTAPTESRFRDRITRVMRRCLDSFAASHLLDERYEGASVSFITPSSIEAIMF